MCIKNKSSLSYEEAYKRLEELVTELESGEKSLEDSMKIFEESIQLVRFCSKMLEEAERKIELLIQDSEETVETDLQSIIEIEE